MAIKFFFENEPPVAIRDNVFKSEPPVNATVKVVAPRMCRYCQKRPRTDGEFCHHPNCDAPREYQLRRDEREENIGNWLVFGLVLFAVAFVWFGQYLINR